MLGHRLADRGQALGEPNQLVVLRLLLLRPVPRVVEVLTPSSRIDAGRLQVGPGSWRDPDVPPGRRDHERLNPLELVLVGDSPPLRLPITKVPARPLPSPAPGSSHWESSVSRAGRFQS